MSALFDDPADGSQAKRKPDQPEHRLSHFCAELLTRILTEPCWFTAQDTAGRAIGATWQEQQNSRMHWEQNQKWYGVKADQLDWRIVQPPIYAEIELKWGKGERTEGQKRTIAALTARGIPTGCAWTLREFYDLLVRAGFRLHGNAANILTEIEARHAAAQDPATMKKGAKPARKSKPRAARATPRQIARTHRIRSVVPH